MDWDAEVWKVGCGRLRFFVLAVCLGLVFLIVDAQAETICDKYVGYTGSQFCFSDREYNSVNWLYHVVENPSNYTVCRLGHCLDVPKRNNLNYDFGFSRISPSFSVGSLIQLVEHSSTYNTTCRYVNMGSSFDWAALRKHIFWDNQYSIYYYYLNQSNLSQTLRSDWSKSDGGFYYVNGNLYFLECNTGWFQDAFNVYGTERIYFNFFSYVVNASGGDYTWADFEGDLIEKQSTGVLQLDWAVNDFVMYQSFDENAGTTTYDQTEVNNGTLTNMDAGTDWVSGRYGYGLDFDGDNDYVRVEDADELDLPKNHTIMVWIKSDNWSAGANPDWADLYLSKGVTAGYYDIGNRGLGRSNTSEYGIKWQDSTITELQGDSTIPLSTWTHITGVCDGTYMYIYVDGILDGTSADISAKTMTSTGEPLTIGGRTTQFYTDGVIDEVYVFNRFLSPTEINQTKDNIHENNTNSTLYDACPDPEVIQNISVTFTNNYCDIFINGTLLQNDISSGTWYDGNDLGDEITIRLHTNSLNITPEISKIEYECVNVSGGECVDDDDCGFCEKCSLGSCVNQSDSEDTKNECNAVNCYTGFCDGSGSCDIYDDGSEGNCGANCLWCNDSDSACDNMPDNQEDNLGVFKCEGNCVACQAGICDIATVGTDPDDDCPDVTDCYTGTCYYGATCGVYDDGGQHACANCMFCNDSDSDCEYIIEDEDPNDNCNTAECYIGTCDGLGNCKIYNDSLKHNCSLCEYCADADWECDYVTVDTDPLDDCTEEDCYTGDCDGGGDCKIFQGGEEGDCAVCFGCTDADSDCDQYADHTQDSVGVNTCTASCYECDDAGECMPQDSDWDVFGHCGVVECDGDAGTPYYFGWNASYSCLYREDEANGACNGTGGCWNAAYYCPSNAVDGWSGVTCNCSDQETGCVNTTIGSCVGGCPTTTTTTPTTTTTIAGTTTTYAGLSEDKKMTLPVWLTLIALSGTFTATTFFIQPPKNIIPTLIAGLLWFITAFSSGSVNQIIVYSTSDYLREYNFPTLIILFGLVGISHIIIAGYRSIKLFEENMDMRDLTWKNEEDDLI